MWNLWITVLNSRTLEEYQIWHSFSLADADVGIIYNCLNHYSAAGECWLPCWSHCSIYWSCCPIYWSHCSIYWSHCWSPCMIDLLVTLLCISVCADEDLEKYVLETSKLCCTMFKLKCPADTEDEALVGISSEDEAEDMDLDLAITHRAVRQAPVLNVGTSGVLSTEVMSMAAATGPNSWSWRGDHEEGCSGHCAKSRWLPWWGVRTSQPERFKMCPMWCWQWEGRTLSVPYVIWCSWHPTDWGSIWMSIGGGNSPVAIVQSCWLATACWRLTRKAASRGLSSFVRSVVGSMLQSKDWDNIQGSLMVLNSLHQMRSSSVLFVQSDLGSKSQWGSISLLVARILLKRGLSFAMWRGVSPAIIPSVEWRIWMPIWPPVMAGKNDINKLHQDYLGGKGTGHLGGCLAGCCALYIIYIYVFLYINKIKFIMHCKLECLCCVSGEGPI